MTEKKSEKFNVDFDDVLEQVGSFGKYQKLVIFLVFLPALLPDGVLVLNGVSSSINLHSQILYVHLKCLGIYGCDAS